MTETTNMACPWDELISAFLDGELDDTEASALEAHLAIHAECRSELDEMTRLRQRVRTLPMRSGTPAFWLRVMDDVAADRPAPSSTTEARTVVSAAASRRWRWASVAASLVVLAAGVAGTRSGGGGAPVTPTEGTTVSRAGVIAGITATPTRAQVEPETDPGSGPVANVSSTTTSTLGSEREWLQQIADAVNDVLN